MTAWSGKMRLFPASKEHPPRVVDQALTDADGVLECIEGRHDPKRPLCFQSIEAGK